MGRPKGHFKYPVDEGAFDPPFTEESAYWAGFIAGDGCIYNKKEGQKVIQIGLADKDIGHVQKFLKFISPGRPYYHTSRGNGTYINLGSVVSDKIANDLSKFGIGERKTFSLDIVPPIDNESAFWRGYFDADGGIYFYPNRRYVVAHLIALPNVMDKFAAWIRINTLHTIKYRPEYKSLVRFRADGTKKPLAVLNALYKNSTIYLDRKYALYQEAVRRYT